MKPILVSTHQRRRFLQSAGALAAMSALPFAAFAAADPAGKMKIGIIGSGRIGGTLGALWAKAGHEVMFSSLDIEHDKKLAASVGPNARAGTSRQAAEFGDVLLLAVPYRAVPEVGKELAGAMKGKVLIDASNPIVPRDGEVGTWAREKGAGDASKELLPGARIVRAFNAIGYARLPEFATRRGVGMPIASDDAKAAEVASRLIREIGLEPVLIGPLTMGKHLIPGTPLAGERSPDEIRKIAATLK
jgi:predicted dinucleotide-binding enzyme